MRGQCRNSKFRTQNWKLVCLLSLYFVFLPLRKTLKKCLNNSRNSLFLLAWWQCFSWPMGLPLLWVLLWKLGIIPTQPKSGSITLGGLNSSWRFLSSTLSGILAAIACSSARTGRSLSCMPLGSSSSWGLPLPATSATKASSPYARERKQTSIPRS